jgi:alpha-beta hydrolase superfamily lysophospholipase
MNLRSSGARMLTSDRVTLAGRCWPTGETVRAGVVLVHGFAASCDQPAVVAVAEELSRNGLHVVSYDARGHGRSGGDCTLGDREQLDVAAAVEVARDGGRPVVLVGASMGAVAVLRYAAGPDADPGLAGVVAVSSPARWTMPLNARAVMAAGLTRTRLGRFLARRHLRVRLSAKWTRTEPPVELVERVRAPVAFVHGECDRFIPTRDVYDLFQAAPAPSHLEVVPGMGHAYDVAAVPAIVRAVDWVLQPASVREVASTPHTARPVASLPA